MPLTIASDTDPSHALAWRVHLLREQPRRLPTVVCVTFLGALCVWGMFGQLLPAVAAALLILGSVHEYLLPVSYRITSEGVFSESVSNRFALPWKRARRLLWDAAGVRVSPLAVPSRLDAFRGVYLRFAQPGRPGDRSSVIAALTRYAPQLMQCDAPASGTGGSSRPMPRHVRAFVEGSIQAGGVRPVLDHGRDVRGTGVRSGRARSIGRGGA